MTATTPETLLKSEIPYYVKALAMALPAMMLGWQISGWIFFLPSALQGRADFRQLYTAGYMVRTGHGRELYDYSAQKKFQDALASPMFHDNGGKLEAVALPFIRPAYQALLFVPLSLLSYKAAYFLFLAANLVALSACILLLRGHLTNLAAAWKPLPVAIFFCFLPAGVALMQGQDSILLLLLLSAAFIQVEHGSEFLAGALVGLAFFKFQIAIPIAALFFFWKRWRFLKGFGITAAFLGLISLSIVGFSNIKAFLAVILSIHTGLGSDPNQIQLIAPVKKMMNVHGLIYWIAEGRLQPLATTLITIAISAAFALYIALAGQRRRGADQFKAAVLTAVVVSYYIFIHDLVILLVPLSFILNETIHRLDRNFWIVGLAACLFLAPAQISYAYLFVTPACAFTVLWLRQTAPSTAG